METVKIAVTFGKTHLVFCLQLLSIADENKLRQQYFGLDEDKTYQVSVDALAKYAAEMPEGLFPNKPEVVSEDDAAVYIEDYSSPEKAVKDYFRDKSAAKERLAEYTIRAYLQSLQPETNFS